MDLDEVDGLERSADGFGNSVPSDPLRQKRTFAVTPSVLTPFVCCRTNKQAIRKQSASQVEVRRARFPRGVHLAEVWQQGLRRLGSQLRCDGGSVLASRTSASGGMATIAMFDTI